MAIKNRWRELEIPKWAEAAVVDRPHRGQREPIVLVRRNMPDLAGPNNEKIVVAPPHPAISLFTGIGGFDIGLEQAGFYTVVQHEWDEMACATLIANRPRYFRHAALIQGDIYLTPTSMILKEGGLRVGEAEMLTGGPPCQGFSTANPKTHAGAYDQRNDLVFQFLRVVDEAKPKFFLFENVPGFVRFNKREYLSAFLKRAHGAYYELVYGLMNAAEYGVPQTRCRFICMGTRRDLVECDGVMGSLPKPHCFGNKDLERLRLIEPLELWKPECELLTHAPGIRYFPDRPLLIPPKPMTRLGRSHKFIEFYRKLEVEEPDRIVRSPQGGEA